MKLTSLRGSNIAGSSFQHVLHPLTVFVGGNTKGKTTRLRALILALAGYCPDLPRKGSEIFAELATGGEMTVGVVADGGHGISRQWAQKRDSVKATVAVSGFPEDFSVPPVLVNAEEFFGLSARERVAFMFARTTSPVTAHAVSATIVANLKSLKLEEHTPEAESALRELVDEIDNLLCDARDAELEVNAIVDRVFESLRESKRLADQNTKRMSGTTAGLAQVAGEEQAPPPPDCEAKLTTARSTYATANSEVGRTRQARVELERQLAEFQRAAVAPNALEIMAELEELTRQRDLAAAVEQPPEFVAGDVVPSPEDARTLSELSARKQALFSATQQTPVDPTEDRKHLELARKNYNEAATRDRDLTREILRLRNERDAAASETCCSKCGQSIVELRKKVVDDLVNKIGELEAKMASSSAVLAIAGENFNLAERAVALADEALALHRRNVDEYRRVDNLHRIARENVVNKARGDRDQAADQFLFAQREVNRCNESINKLRARLEDKSAASAAERVPAKQAELALAVTAHDVAARNAETAREQVTKLEGQVRRLSEIRTAAAQRARVEEETRTASAKAALLKLAVESVTGLKADMVKNAVEPLVERMNEVIGQALNGKRLVYDDGRIGFRVGSAFVERTMSGAERALVYCAVSVVLATESPLRLLILDEVGRLDVDTKLAFLETVSRLINEGKIHQVVMADTSDADYRQFAATENNFGVIRV